MAKYTSCEREINKSLKEILDITYTSVEDTSSNRIKDKESKYYKMQSSIGHLLSIVEYDHKKDDSKQGYGSSLKRGPLVASAGKSDEFMYHSASEVPKKKKEEKYSKKIYLKTMQLILAYMILILKQDKL